MYTVIALIGLMLLTWSVAVWASYRDETSEDREHPTNRMRMFCSVA